MIRIGKQIDRETKLVAEALVRLDVVFTYSDDGDVRIIKVLLGRSKRFALNRAARRVVLRIDVNDEPFAFEVIQLNGLAVLVLEVEIYEALAFSEVP